MSSRFPPTSSDSRYPPRDQAHTPPGFGEKRTVAPYNGPLSSRPSENTYRGSTGHVYQGPGRDAPREAPRGPKAGFDTIRGGGYAQRGRGYAGRGDNRDLPFQRRDVDREWSRRDSFDNRDRRPSPTAPTRSRTPPGRDFREPRELDLTRVRRGSRDGPLSANSTISDTATSGWDYGRGGGRGRGRGRGDWEGRGRGRGHFFDDRDGPPPRSHSRDRIWDRESREDRARDHDRDVGRREDEKKNTNDEWDRERDSDRYRRELPQQRPDSRTSSGTHTRPSTPHSASIPPPAYANAERSVFKSSGAVADGARRPSTSALSIDSSSRDDPRSYIRSEHPRNQSGPGTPSSPPQAPQVPAFGSVAHRAPAGSHAIVNRPHQSKEDGPLSAPGRFETTDLIKAAPKAPKAELSQAQPPTGPKAGISFARHPQTNNVAASGRGFGNYDTRLLSQGLAPSTQSPSTVRFGVQQRPIASQFFSQTAPAPMPQISRTINTRPALTNASKPSTEELTTTNGLAGPERSNRSNLADSASRTNPNVSSTGSPIKIPRGPKNQPSIRAPMATKTIPNQWINPNMMKRTPSIMNRPQPTIYPMIPAKRDHTGEERIVSQPSDQLRLEALQTITEHEDTQQHVKPQDSKAGVFDTGDNSIPRKTSNIADDVTLTRAKLETGILQGSNFTEGVKSQSDSVSEEDEGMDLDEADFEETERQFTKEMRALEAKRPATPRHHAELLPLLEEIDALESALEDINNGNLPEMDEAEEKYEAEARLGLPSPSPETAEKPQLESDFSCLKQEPNAAQTPPLSEENLPYLISGPPTPLSEISDIQHVLQHDLIRVHIMNSLGEKQEDLDVQYSRMREEYADLYKPWRIRVEAMERQKASEEGNTTPSPVPIETPSLIPTPIVEGRRVGRSSTSANLSELDYQRVVEYSKQEAAEAAEIRERQAQENQALADLQKEAVIPDMLPPDDRKHSLFEDTNHLIPTRMALEVLAFVPPEDDFTPKEHELFTEYYMTFPKKWGQIAGYIPGRDYQDCIQHYYLSKKANDYKKQIKDRPVPKKGRKTKVPKVPSRSGALMADMGPTRVAMYDGGGNDTEQPQFTSAGRPRRTAAPTFGERDTPGDGDTVTPVPTPGRRGAGSSKGDVTGDSTSERPTIKRARTATRDKGAKRSKAPLLAAAPGPSPSKKEVDVGRGKSKEPKIEDLQRPQEMKQFEVPTTSSVEQIPEAGPWLTRPPTYTAPVEVEMVPGPSPLPQPGILQQQISHDSQPRPPSQATSYWSVPEQQDFTRLVGYYGHDWQQISQALKTKTHIMVKNHFFREVDKGKTELEDAAKQADERNERGEPRGNPPQPSITIPKRRLDATGHVSSHRPLAPNTENTDLETESPGYQPIGIPQVSPPSVQQRLAPLLQPGTAGIVASSNTPSQFTGNINARIQSTSQPQRTVRSLQGPPSGTFTVDRQPPSAIQPGPIPPKSQADHHQSQIRHHQHQQQQQQPPPPPQQQIMHQQQKPALTSQDFEQLMGLKHFAKQEQDNEGIAPRHARSISQQAHAPDLSQTVHNRQSNPLLLVRTSSEHLHEAERKHQPVALQQSSASDPSPPPLRRLDSLGQISFLESRNHSPQQNRAPIISPQQDLVRPNSVPSNTTVVPVPPPAARAPAAPGKRSNLMSLLNDESTDPQPRRSVSDVRLAAPTPPPQSPASSSQVYQHSSQLLSQFSRRDAMNDIAQGLQQQQQQQQLLLRTPYGQHPQQILQQQQQQQGPTPQQHQIQQQGAQQRENLNTWSNQRSIAEQRPSLQPQVSRSPHSQQAFIQPASRPTFQHVKATHARSPTLAPSHSRNSSYTNLHPHQIQQQVQQVQTTQALKPSPYGQILPQHYPQQQQPHSQQSQQTRPQSTFPLQSLQQDRQGQQQHLETIRQDPLRGGTQRFNALRDYQQELMRREQQQQQYYELQRQQDQVRLQESMGRAGLSRTYTPPMYGQQGPYGSAPPPQQDPNKRRGYEDQR